MARSTRTRRSMLVVAVLAALVLAACGNDDGGSEASPTEEWADSVCTAIDTWETTLAGAVNTLTDFSGGSVTDNVRTAVDQVVDATKDLAGAIESAGAPPTEAGEQISDDLSAASSTVRADIDSAKATFDDLGSSASPSALLQSLASIAADFEDAVRTVQQTWTTVTQLEGAAGAEVQAAIQSTPACQGIGAGSGS